MTHDTTKSTYQNSTRSEEKHDDNGNEIPDPTPMQPPLGYKKSLSLAEQIQQQVRQHTLKMLQDQQLDENDDDADDFEVGEDYEPLSKYENDHVPTLAALKQRAKEINDQIRQAQLKQAIKDHENNIRKPGFVQGGRTQPPNNDLTLPPTPEE